MDIRLRGAGSIASGSGKRSLEVPRVRKLRSRRVCCRALVSGGSVRVAACRLSPSRRYPGVICPSPSERRSRSCSPAVLGCERSRVGSVVRRRRSPESCSAMLRSAAAELNIGLRRLRGMRSVELNDPSRRSSRSTRSCVAMCKTGSPDLCSGPTGASPVRWSAGADGVRDRERTGAGDSLGARSRSPVDSVLTSPMMSRCPDFRSWWAHGSAGIARGCWRFGTLCSLCACAHAPGRAGAGFAGGWPAG